MIRGLPFSTFTPRGEGVGPRADIVLWISNGIVLESGGCVNLLTRGMAVQKSETVADLLAKILSKFQCPISSLGPFPSDPFKITFLPHYVP